MLQRIAAVVITLVGVALAIVVGFWVLVILGAVALVAACVYFLRTYLLDNFRSRRGDDERRRNANVIEGEYTVVDEEEKRDDEH
jgi:membrane protein implicated in regulation of membrane protease activity